MTKMQLPSKTAMLFNGAAILIGASSLIFVLRSSVFTAKTPGCTERYGEASRLALSRDEVQPISAGDLQAQLGNTDWGLLGGAKIVKLRTGPAKFAMELDLGAVPTVNTPVSGDSRPGVGFRWAPKEMRLARSACLSYSVFVPEGFGFGKGGRLPGLAGASPIGGEDASKQDFSMRYTWGPNGDIDIFSQVPDWPDGRPLTTERKLFTLEPGKWLNLEQEVVLNAPGEKDGVLRVWVDGELVLQRTDMIYRHKPSATITGVLAEAVGGAREPGTGRGVQKLWVTPFEVRWQ